MVKDLLEAGADPTLAPADGVLPLHLAARADSPDMIAMLLAAAPSTLNRRDARGISALCWASGAGSSRAVSTLLAAGASDRQTLMAGGTSPLTLAIEANQRGIVRILLNEGFAAIGGVLAVPGAMKMAVECGRSGILKTLVDIQGEEKREHWALCTPQGIPMLFWAVGRSSLRATHLLLAAGADETSRFCSGQLPSDAIGSSLSESARNPALEAAVGRMLKRGPAFRARSWAWNAPKADAGATGAGSEASDALSGGANPGVALGVRIFRARKRFFVSRFVR